MQNSLKKTHENREKIHEKHDKLFKTHRVQDVQKNKFNVVSQKDLKKHSQIMIQT